MHLLNNRFFLLFIQPQKVAYCSFNYANLICCSPRSPVCKIEPRMRKVIERSHLIQLSLESQSWCWLGFDISSAQPVWTALQFNVLQNVLFMVFFFFPKNPFRQFNMRSLVDNWFNWKCANPFLSVYTLVNKLIMNWLLIIILCRMSFHGLCFPKHWVTTIFIRIYFIVSVCLAMCP